MGDRRWAIGDRMPIAHSPLPIAHSLYSMLKLRITYCGGCNPEIDRGRVVERLMALMESENIKFRHVSDSETPDLVLIVNGCAHACKEEALRLGTESFPFVSVQGEKLQFQDVAEDRLPGVLLEKIMPHSPPP